ncbi:50S ribosomal protein L21 [Patescibacteria group bacterium]|nr:50S ribosomal protein L21 [Patescibacteria group bacterium]
MEYAVIKTGGKQYVVKSGDLVTIEKFMAPDGNDVKKGDAVIFTEVLLKDDGAKATIGSPMVKGATVTGTVSMVGRAKKIDVVKYKAKSRYLKRRGHRQPFVKVKIDAIS